MIVTFFVLIAMILAISSSFENGIPNFEITKQYSQNDTIKGWINISLKDEPADSLFTDSFNNSISLIDLLELNNNLKYECSPSDCENDYSSSNPENAKTFSLNKGESEIIGIKITGDNFETVSDFSINVSSTVGESTEPQLYIDILDNGKFEWVSNKPSNNFYNEDYGCYDSPDETVLIYNDRYCEKINIPVAPNVEIGARIIIVSGGQVSFDISICDENTINCNFCEATALGELTEERISCVLDKKIEKRANFFVCINTKNSADENKYEINSDTNSPCGFANIEANERDFEIFAKPGKYSAVGEFTLNNEELENEESFIDLRFYIEEYMARYNNSCPDGCIIPIKFTANEPQTITVSDASILYTISGTPTIENEIYDLTKIPVTISSDFQQIYLDNANFVISGDFEENMSYFLNLNENEIISDKITIAKIPKIISISPRIAIAAYPLVFRANIETFDSANITKYLWNFGDGNLESTEEDKIIHIYNSIGTYSLKLSITDSNSFTSSRTFNVSIKTPKRAINSVLKSKLDSLNNISSQIDGLSSFYKNSLKEFLNIEGIGDELSSLQQRNATAISDEDYVSIMENLFILKIPESIFKNEIASEIKFYPNKDRINLEILKSIAGGDFDSDTKEEYVKSILSWHLNNIDMEIDSKKFSVVYEDSTKKALNFFEVKIDKNQERRDSYFIMYQLDGLEFKENYNERKIDNYVYIEITDNAKTFEFSTTEDILFSELPAFISPSISELPIVSVDISETEDKFSKQSIIILSVILAFFIGLISYIAVQTWYKRKYENYLFKNKNSLYNIVSYVKSAKEKKLENKETITKLKKAGWNSEQITYVMKKYVGERTGMFEIPIEKILNFFGKNKVSNGSKIKFQSPPKWK